MGEGGPESGLASDNRRESLRPQDEQTVLDAATLRQSSNASAILAEGDRRLSDIEAQAGNADKSPAGTSIFRIPTRELAPAPDKFIYSIGRETQIYAEPNYDARRIGYMRFGAAVRRTSSPQSSRSCPGGWHGIQPTGFVCVNGRTATLDANHPLLQVSMVQPDRMASLPYSYAIARRGAPAMFGFAPIGVGRPSRSFSKRLLSSFDKMQTHALPDWWRTSHEIFGFQRSKADPLIGSGLVGGGLALLGFYEDADMLFAVTPELELVTTEALEAAKVSTFAGIAFQAEQALPAAFVMSGSAWLFRGDPRTGKQEPLRQLKRREVILLDPDQAREPSRDWLRTRDGQWLRASGLRIVEARTEWPEWARSGQPWVDVSINQQTLVAYEGTRVAYATLVSTGVDGLLDPATTKSTKMGTFRILSKHLTATMNGEDAEGSYEMREVPWVQYFSEGYALHGAYWHDGFGQPRSHGCINLSPVDARWLFHFTNPGLPQNWHGTVLREKSATVYVHP